eukprot:TRINITY_DN1674_c0_g1_i3.p1 TRINITY_DN1674_c0_g1~~TRINITY_DN1674_c0_g1_i3.p1  ORF type:complete len:668 (-),score=118.96 TRINITY_DN1674_c0_g1_i3:574-2577(-)
MSSIQSCLEGSDTLARVTFGGDEENLPGAAATIAQCLSVAPQLSNLQALAMAEPEVRLAGIQMPSLAYQPSDLTPDAAAPVKAVTDAACSQEPPGDPSTNDATATAAFGPSLPAASEDDYSRGWSFNHYEQRWYYWDGSVWAPFTPDPLSASGRPSRNSTLPTDCTRPDVSPLNSPLGNTDGGGDSRAYDDDFASVKQVHQENDLEAWTVAATESRATGEVSETPLIAGCGHCAVPGLANGEPPEEPPEEPPNEAAAGNAYLRLPSSLPHQNVLKHQVDRGEIKHIDDHRHLRDCEGRVLEQGESQTTSATCGLVSHDGARKQVEAQQRRAEERGRESVPIGDAALAAAEGAIMSAERSAAADPGAAAVLEMMDDGEGGHIEANLPSNWVEDTLINFFLHQEETPGGPAEPVPEPDPSNEAQSSSTVPDPWRGSHAGNWQWEGDPSGWVWLDGCGRRFDQQGQPLSAETEATSVEHNKREKGGADRSAAAAVLFGETSEVGTEMPEGLAVAEGGVKGSLPTLLPRALADECALAELNGAAQAAMPCLTLEHQLWQPQGPSSDPIPLQPALLKAKAKALGAVDLWDWAVSIQPKGEESSKADKGRTEGLRRTTKEWMLVGRSTPGGGRLAGKGKGAPVLVPAGPSGGVIKTGTLEEAQGPLVRAASEA